MTMSIVQLPEQLRKGDGLDPLREEAYIQAMTGPVKNVGGRAPDAKTKKSLKKKGIITLVTYLAPADVSGFEMCRGRTKGCSNACLFTAGQGVFRNVKIPRLRKTYQFLFRRDEYMERLSHEIGLLGNYARKKGLAPAARLNATSDIAWENIPVGDHKNIFAAHPDIMFYDYTKIRERLPVSLRYDNYHLTFSWAETKANQKSAMWALENGFSVAMVFDSIPEKHLGYRVVVGEDHDARYLDSPDGEPVIVGLVPKGPKARKDKTGFVIRLNVLNGE